MFRESEGLKQFRVYVKSLGENPKLPTTSMMMQATGLTGNQVTYYIGRLRRKMELPASSPEEKSRRISVDRTVATGNKWLKVLPYGQLRMSPIEARVAMIIDGVIDADNQIYNSGNMRNLFSTARKNGLERFSKEEGSHADRTTVKVPEDRMHERVYRWLNSAQVLRDQGFAFRTRMGWFGLVDYLGDQYPEASRLRLSDMPEDSRRRFKNLVLNRGDYLIGEGNILRLKGNQTGKVVGTVEQDGVEFIKIRLLTIAETVDSYREDRVKVEEFRAGDDSFRLIPRDIIRTQAELVRNNPVN